MSKPTSYKTSEGVWLDHYVDYTWYHIKIKHETHKAILIELYSCKDPTKPTRAWVPKGFIAKTLKDGDGFQMALHYSFSWGKYITRTHYQKG